MEVTENKEVMEFEAFDDIIQLKPTKSKLVTACYVVAIIALLFAVYAIFSTVAYLVSYSKAYGMPVKFADIIKYVLQGGVLPIAVAFFSFVLGRILQEIRLLNPDYYVEAEVLTSDEAMTEETESDDTCDDEACSDGDLSDDCDKCSCEKEEKSDDKDELSDENKEKSDDKEELSDEKDDASKCDEEQSEDQ